jgi:hypothetical protein
MAQETERKLQTASLEMLRLTWTYQPYNFTAKHNLILVSLHWFTYELSNTFLAPSTILLTSVCPFFTTSSIRLPAFCRSSGSTSLSSLKFLNFLLCAWRATCIALSATSAAFCAVSSAAWRVSPVGGGIGTGIVRGESGCGGWGVRFWPEAAMAVVMGLMYF